MHWAIYAVGAAFVWGIHYNLMHQLTKTNISPFTYYWIPTIACIVALPWIWNTLVTDFRTILEAPLPAKIAFGLITFTGATASMLMFMAIRSSGNPSMIGTIEVTYPLFVALIAYLLFQENQLNPSIMLGGALTMIGTAIIIYNN